MIAASQFPDKSALRRHMRERRAACALASPDAADRAAAALPLDALPRFRVASGYWPAGAEMSPLPLLRRLARDGAVLALPVAEDRDAPLGFRRWSEGDALAPDAFGIPSPQGEGHIDPDLVVTPLLAFDAQGARLGQGAGHYDRTLERLRAEGRIFVLGLGYAGQEVDRLPTEAHDQRLDAVLTEAGYRRIAA